MALAKRNYKKENKQPINKFIKADKVRLISSSGEQLGIKSIDDALSIAAKENLDLVQLNDDKDTPVCKLMNYGKHLFDKKKQKSASKKKQKKTQIKEVKFRPGTEENDYQIKLKKINFRQKFNFKKKKMIKYLFLILTPIFLFAQKTDYRYEGWPYYPEQYLDKTDSLKWPLTIDIAIDVKDIKELDEKKDNFFSQRQGW